MSHERIELNDSLQDVVVKLAEGNPGAVNVIMGLVAKGPSIDPQNAFGAFGSLLMLDSLGIYGPRIWLMAKDICGQDCEKMIGLLRAFQLGLMPQKELHDALDNIEKREPWELDVDGYFAKVKEKLADFAVKESEEIADASS